MSLLWLVGPGSAQSPSPTPTPIRQKTGFIRIWNVIPPEAKISLDLVVGSTPDGRVLSTATPSNYYANYGNLPAATYVLQVFRAGDRQAVVKTLSVALRDRSYFTLLATQGPEGRVNVELLDDTPDPAKPSKNRLTVRQFCQDATVIITTSGNHKTDPLPFGKTQTLEDLPDGAISLSMRATRAGQNAVKTWETTADFRAAHHATLFIVNDLYGRIRARVATDGPTPAEEAAAAAEARNTP